MSSDLSIESPSRRPANPGGEPSRRVDYDSPSESGDGNETRNRLLANAKWLVGRSVHYLCEILSLPFYAYLSLRRSMSMASVVVLLTLVMTLNVVWGFPWSGMMGIALAMLLGGWAINRLMRPKVSINLSLPRSAIVGSAFTVNVRVKNRRNVPAVDLRLGWHREGLHDYYHRASDAFWEASPPVSLPLMKGGDNVKWHGAMRYDRRGIHDLPPFQVSSSFPFHLFHFRRGVATDTRIAITPAPLSGDNDPTARMMMASIGDWAQQLVAGAPVEYIGNREYSVGMPVRKWDFASWARLGRPIVREYQAPSIQSVTLIVDVAQPTADSLERGKLSGAEAGRRREQSDAEFERLLSVATTAVHEICSRQVQLKMYVTSEDGSEVASLPQTSQGVETQELFFVRLAAAKRVDRSISESRIREVIDGSRGEPVLLLSLFASDQGDRSDLVDELPSNVTYVPVLAEKSQ